jgi:hypothetical protein
VAEAAWGRKLDSTDSISSGFFHFAWQSAVWLAFGLADGQVRGVYCPIHRAERDARSAGCEGRFLSQPAQMAVPA